MKKSVLTISVLSLAGLTACSDPAYVTGDGAARDEYRNTKQGAIFGGLIGAGLAAVTDKNVAVGAAVGLGNIWRFPRIAAQNAGDDGAGES